MSATSSPTESVISLPLSSSNNTAMVSGSGCIIDTSNDSNVNLNRNDKSIKSVDLTGIQAVNVHDMHGNESPEDNLDGGWIPKGPPKRPVSGVNKPKPETPKPEKPKPKPEPKH